MLKAMSFNLVLLFLSLVNGCSATEQNGIKLEQEDSAKHYYYIMKKEEKDQLIKKLSTIKIGMSWVAIRGLIGEPDVDTILASKKGGVFKSRNRIYFIKLYKKGMVNELLDERIVLVFDKSDTLIDKPM